jgi:hypothetical protein
LSKFDHRDLVLLVSESNDLDLEGDLFTKLVSVRTPETKYELVDLV